jgi:hypothetical protein
MGKNNEIKVFKTSLNRIFEIVIHKICQNMHETYFRAARPKLAKLE